ncbi:MAG: preprotein translocase subunit SecG [Pseudomonadota bacterium]
MQNIILVIHILICIGLTAVVLLQRSEGGALGIGGGGPGGGLMSGRGAAGALVRTTMIFAGVFLLTSLTLTTMAARSGDGLTEIERELESEAGDSDTIDVLDPTTSLLDDPILSDPLAEGSDDVVVEDPLAESPDDPLAEADPEETP